ncbi:RidA family protein, partial [Acinetobacter baumannii]
MGGLVVEKVVVPGAAEPPGATWSNCLVIGDEIVISGQHARGPDGGPIGGDDLYLQAQASLAKIADL